jgi:REP element-mobilizing transposase RayT
MRYDPRTHHRRSIRLAGFDYSRAGAYFVTICAHNRELFLQAESVRDAVRTAWYELPERFPGVVLDEFVIMPNHIHGIIILEGRTASSVPTVLGAASGAPTPSGAASGAPTPLGAARRAPALGRVVRAFKSLSGIEANRALGRSNRPFWQRNYHEHVIRDEGELNAIRQYIQTNPGNWPDDPDNPSNV